MDLVRLLLFFSSLELLLSHWDYRCAVGLSLYSIRGVERKMNHYNDNEDDTDTKDSSEIWHVVINSIDIVIIIHE